MPSSAPRVLALTLLGAVAAGCGTAERRASVLDLRHPADLELDRVSVRVTLPTEPPRTMETLRPEAPRRLDPAGETLRLELPPDLPDGSVSVEVVGLLGGAPRARGEATFPADDPGPHRVDLRPLGASDADGGIRPDAGPSLDAGGAIDAGDLQDAGFAPDAAPTDAGFPPDAAPTDAGFAPDAAPTDAGFAPDAAPADTGPADVGVWPDAAPADTGVWPDAAPADTGPADAGVWPDAAPADTGPTDTGASPDAGPSPDAGLSDQGTAAPDSGSMDAGFMDAGAIDAGVPSTPSQLSLSATGATIPWSACGSSPVTVELRDAQDRPATSSAPTTVSLSSSPAASVAVFTDSGCSADGAQLTIPAGQSSATVYLRGVRRGPFSLTANASGLSADTIDRIVETCATGSCGGGACCSSAACSAGSDCSRSCTQSAVCQLDCTDANNCNATCDQSASCLLDCQDANNCDATCRRGADCTIECQGANNCDNLVCQQGASCLVFCGNANNCDFDTCQGGRSTCPGGVIVCNRACP